MTFYKKAIALAGILLCAAAQLTAQVRMTREEYIDRYKSIAVADMPGEFSFRPMPRL